jgi:hypothetical protein
VKFHFNFIIWAVISHQILTCQTLRTIQIMEWSMQGKFKYISSCLQVHSYLCDVSTSSDSDSDDLFQNINDNELSEHYLVIILRQLIERFVINIS